MRRGPVKVVTDIRRRGGSRLLSVIFNARLRENVLNTGRILYLDHSSRQP